MRSIQEERRFFASGIELRGGSSGGGGLPRIVGYGAVFNTLSEPLSDSRGKAFREIIRPGAFLRSLANAQQGKADILARFEHSTILGRVSNGTLRLHEDERGLRYEIDPPDTGAGRDLITLIRRGDVKGRAAARAARGSANRCRGREHPGISRHDG
jgi:HK97 family phage prohead protease